MAGNSTEIKLDYDNIEEFRKAVVLNGSYLGRDFNEGKKDNKSTIVANGNAHSAIDNEKNIRTQKQHMTTRESTNIAIVVKSFKDTEGVAIQQYQNTFSYNVSSSSANGTTP
ncbi:TIGR04197 family type VII secretion effector [Butyrivibrio sp. M55]|uniref:TIGR04197 family type VII secretion effector n=1 Tax=Butyrivibrio sp. M55 TaxID=1855323 RepID=UPI0008DEDD7C|nr:TIGR04197 family type VII secretion effector [Butyrivibrio sp. M55]SFU79028.1 type VII secretion effector, SACOL2603 family [Butyrivibrio sp. M55]